MRDVSNLQHMKRLNRLSILNIIREHKSISRQELAKVTGLTSAAISGIVREFFDKGYIEEVGPGESSGGRRPMQLQFNPAAGYVVGAEVTRKVTTVGIVDLQVKPVVIARSAIDMTEPEQGLRFLVREMMQMISANGIPREKVLSFGFAFPGLMDESAKLKRSPNLGELWRDIPVAAGLANQVHAPLFIENNSKAAALAEHDLGKGKEIKDFVYVNLGEGFSAGVITDGKLFYGSHGYAGEMGHLVIVENGPLCNCGNRGCLESLYAVPALVQRANAELSVYLGDDPLKTIWCTNGMVSIGDILSCSKEVDSYSWQLIRQAGWYIGIGIANIINFYNPKAVFLGGILSAAGDVLLEPLLDSVARHAFPEVAKDTRIEFSVIGRDAAFYGACVGSIRKLFDIEGDMGFIQENS